MSDGEFAPASRKIKMSKAQVRKYIAEMEERRMQSKLLLEKEDLIGELNKTNNELKQIEDQFDDVY